MTTTSAATGARDRDFRPVLLVLRALGVGDLLTAVPALRALADAFPGYRRVLAAPARLRPLAEMSGAVEDVLDTAELRPVVVDRPPVVAVNLHGRGPQSHRIVLATRPERMLAFAHRDVGCTRGHPRWRRDEHEVARWCRLLSEEGVPADPARLDVSPPPGPVPERARGATVVHPGAADVARRWPVERFARVARAEARSGRTVLVTGGPSEVGLAEEVAARAGLPDDSVLAGRTDLARLARVVAVAGRLVSGDTGIAHLATALRTPSVVLFGPTSPAAWGPPRDRAWHRVLWAGRTDDPHGTRPDPGLLEISVSDVLAALDGLPGRPQAAARRSA
ncbi:MAG TPA: glycosyltransferase family 9 protein [Acidimicrobiia bacterium]|nr:glycosyltransferase family 9 protein [Acidimicrobiia bacterium]